MSGARGFRVRESRSVLHAGFLEVVEDELESPDGEILTRFTVRHPGAVVVVPVDDNGDAVLVRQFRTAARGELLEVPAGKREPGEEPAATAAREMEEEVGLRADRLVKLAEFYNSPGFTDELTHVFLGLGLTPSSSVAELKAEERHMAVVRVPLTAVEGLIATGELADAKSLIGLTLAQRYIVGEFEGFRDP